MCAYVRCALRQVYGMMGWRVGYLAYAKSSNLGPELLKVQDTIPICPSTISQKLAVSAIAQGEGWIQSKVTSLHENKSAVIDALSPLGSGNVYGGDGSIYLFCKLPLLSDIAGHTQAKLRDMMARGGLAEDEYDKAVIEWLAKVGVRAGRGGGGGKSCDDDDDDDDGGSGIAVRFAAAAAAAAAAAVREGVESWVLDALTMASG